MTTALDRITTPAAAPSPDALSQATAVEQSRAVAEVHAAVVVAQQRPRDIQAALNDMRDVCRLKSLAERAFYSYRKAGSTIEGPSINLARELARIWGNIQYGITELRRGEGYSEMQAMAWDLQTNTRSTQVFVVPHRRDKGQGADKTQVPILDLAGVYENNANQGGRRLRAAIFSILPAWFRDEAVDICNATLEDGGGIPLHQRIKSLIDAFDTALDVTQAQLEHSRGAAASAWTERDLARLTILGRSLRNNEISVAEAFPTSPVTADEVTAQARPKTNTHPVDPADPGPIENDLGGPWAPETAQ